MIIFAILNFAGVVKLVDTLDLGSSASRCEGSSPFARTKKKLLNSRGFFVFGIKLQTSKRRVCLPKEGGIVMPYSRGNPFFTQQEKAEI
jgi:hypothetical protein